MEWIQTIMKAVHYIENNLTNDISLEDVSNHIFMSSSNFQRIFNSVTGITIGDYIRNRRLSLAGQDLFLTDSKVIDIAMRYQYDTSESFSKAFTRFHGIPPSVAQKQSDMLKFFHPFTINVFIQGGFNMSKEIIVPTFRGEWGEYEVTENGVTAKRFNGEILFHFEKLDSKPSSVKFESSSEKGDISVSIQYLKDGQKNNHPDNMETREESATGNGVFDLSKLKNGYYILRIFAKDAENVSFKYEFLN
ncbi:MAG: AraC family transcriptional regulator [Oscillospiraceae bacterium]|nr:AraC family transcriptional regulator [Oscillospiraceae bacterium]